MLYVKCILNEENIEVPTLGNQRFVYRRSSMFGLFREQKNDVICMTKHVFFKNRFFHWSICLFFKYILKLQTYFKVSILDIFTGRSTPQLERIFLSSQKSCGVFGKVRNQRSSIPSEICFHIWNDFIHQKCEGIFLSP